MEFSYIGKGLYLVMNKRTVKCFGVLPTKEEAEKVRDIIVNAYCAGSNFIDKSEFIIYDVDDGWEEFRAEKIQEIKDALEDLDGTKKGEEFKKLLRLVGSDLEELKEGDSICKYVDLVSKSGYDESITGIVTGEANMWFLKELEKWFPIKDKLIDALCDFFDDNAISFEKIDFVEDGGYIIVSLDENDGKKPACILKIDEIDVVRKYYAIENKEVKVDGMETGDDYIYMFAKHIFDNMIEGLEERNMLNVGSGKKVDFSKMS